MVAGVEEILKFEQHHWDSWKHKKLFIENVTVQPPRPNLISPNKQTKSNQPNNFASVNKAVSQLTMYDVGNKLAGKLEIHKSRENGEKRKTSSRACIRVKI